MNIFSNYFLLAANVASKEMNPNADAEWAELKASFTEETNSDTGKNNHKLIIASIGNQVMSHPTNVIVDCFPFKYLYRRCSIKRW